MPVLSYAQRYYLDAMGIDYWVRRSLAADSATAVSLPAEESGVDVAGFDWDQLQSAVANCTRCALASGRTQTVFGVGDKSADCMIIGEAPGAEEDRRGEPFVGRAGQLLTAMLFAIGLEREQVYIANILKCRPPGNRDPRSEEVASCADYLQRQIALVKPKIIIAVGRIAAQNLLNTDTPIGRLRGQRFSYGADGIPVVVTYHPAYLLRSPAQKSKAWADLSLVKSILAGQS
jgi:uracil-DNA glycosylase family 4